MGLGRNKKGYRGKRTWRKRLTVGLIGIGLILGACMASGYDAPIKKAIAGPVHKFGNKFIGPQHKSTLPAKKKKPVSTKEK